MSGKRPVSFANFVCRFGEEEMLDQLDHIVLPAFFGKHKRKYGETTYVIHQPKLIDLGYAGKPSEPAICGRFVKDTILHSRQVLEGDSLQSSSAKIQAAPSAVFVLLLRSHKLIYFSEFPGSPGLEAFQNTIIYFLRTTRQARVQELYSQANANLGEDEKRVTKKSISDSLALPTLQVIPLTNEETLQEQLDRFKILKTVSVRLVRPNNEIDASKFFAQARTTAQTVKSEQTTLSFKGSPEGLVKSAVKETVEGALTGNAEVAMSGTANSGAKLSIKNDDMKVTALIDRLVEPMDTTARRLMAVFHDYVAQKMIAMAPDSTSHRLASKLQSVLLLIATNDGS